MNRFKVWKSRFIFLSFLAAFLVGLLLHFIPMLTNNFYFTMDQGNEAVYAREIWFRHQLVLTGPETSIPGLFNGPLWHWFISIGYIVFGGHPIGPLVLLVFLNLGLSMFLMQKVFRYVSFWPSITLGFALQFFWPFYDTSRYAFSPFALVFCNVIAILLLESFLRGNKRSFIFAAFPVSLTFHTELASFPPLLFIYLFIGIWSLFKKLLTWSTLAYGIVIVFIFFIPHVLSEAITNFSQFWSVHKSLSSEQTVFAGAKFVEMTQVFIMLIGKSVVPQKPYIGAVIFLLVFLFFIKYCNHNIFIKRFIFLSLLLVGISWIWFSSNIGWHSWHTVYVAPLLFISLLLMLFSLPKKIGVIFISTVLIFQLGFFYKAVSRYTSSFGGP